MLEIISVNDGENDKRFCKIRTVVTVNDNINDTFFTGGKKGKDIL